MLSFQLPTITPALRTAPIMLICAQLAQSLGSSYANNLRTVIVRRRAIATGKTLQSVKNQLVLDSPSRGIFERNVTARRTWMNIQNGRRAGLKMPIKKVGNKFEPVTEMVEWFLALNIPKSAWFPILRKIARDGIKPRDLQNLTMRMTRPRLNALAAQAGRDIATALAQTANPTIP